MKYRVDMKFGCNGAYFYGQKLFDDCKSDEFGLCFMTALSLVSHPKDQVIVTLVEDKKEGEKDG